MIKPTFKVEHFRGGLYKISYSFLCVFWVEIEEFHVSSSNRKQWNHYRPVMKEYKDAVKFAKSFDKSWSNIKKWNTIQKNKRKSVT